MPSLLDQRQVRRGFDRAAAGFDAAAALPGEVRARLLGSLDYLDDTVPAVVLDLGSGTGHAAAAMKKRWPKSQVLALDLSLSMLRQSRRQAGWWRPFTRLCADARALPLADGSVDLVFANLSLAWMEDLPAVFAGLRRVLRPGGLLLCSSFGPETLGELQAAFTGEHEPPQPIPLLPIAGFGDAMVAAGFRDPVLDRDLFTLTWPDLRALLRELRATGMGNALARRRRGLTGRGRFAAASAACEALRDEQGRLPSTWEVIYAHAWAPAPGAPIREGGHDVASVPLAQIPIRRRT
ncbi:MAG: methyltransferase domain-containing protein [Pseudoxanthomonas sp.]|nr:methyltransferase domain-containing protein [Pseudoxanthomonas sp.]